MQSFNYSKKFKITTHFFIILSLVLIPNFTCYNQELSNYFINKHWEGKIAGAVKEELKNRQIIWHPFEVKLYGKNNEGFANLVATYPKFTYSSKIGVVISKTEKFYRFTFLGDVGDPAFMPALSYFGIFNAIGFDIVNFEKDTLYLNFAGSEKNDGMRAKGEIWTITKKILNFEKEIKYNQPIKTDNKTQIKILLPQKNILTLSTNSEIVFKSDSVVEIIKGKIYNLINKLKPKTKFEINTPIASVGVRGTIYIVEVDEKETTIITVLDGKVNVKNKITNTDIVAEKNQKVFVNNKDTTLKPLQTKQKEEIFPWWE